jgi:hypothetical protein
MRNLRTSFLAPILAVLVALSSAQATPKASAAQKQRGAFVAATAQAGDNQGNQAALINLALGFWEKKPSGALKPIIAFVFVLGLTKFDDLSARLGLVGGGVKSITVTNGNTIVFDMPKVRYVVTKITGETNSNRVTVDEELNVPASGSVGFAIGPVAPGFIGIVGSEFKNTDTSEPLFAYQFPVPQSNPDGGANVLSLEENLAPSHPLIKSLKDKKTKDLIRKTNAKIRKVYSVLAKGFPKFIEPPARPPTGAKK